MRVQVSEAVKNSPSFVNLGSAIKVLIGTDGALKLISNPMPGIKLSIRSVNPNNAVLVEECDKGLHLVDFFTLSNPASLDAKTREALRTFRESTGVLLNPLEVTHGRTPIEIPEGMHSAFWAYHK